MRVFISFDFDRTLADYSRAHGNSILAGIHETFNNKFYVNWIDLAHSGFTDLQIITSLVHNQGVSYHHIFDNMNLCLRSISQKFHEYVLFYPVELLDDAEKTLQNLSNKDNVTIGLSTGNIKSICLSKTKFTNIDEYFSFGSFGNQAFNRYQLLELTKNRLKLNYSFSKNDFAFHIGDSLLDMKAARKSGFIPIGIATGGYSKVQLLQSGAKYVFNDLKEFNKSFDSILDKLEEKKHYLPIYMHNQ